MITRLRTAITSLEKQVENPPGIIDDTPLRKQQVIHFSPWRLFEKKNVSNEHLLKQADISTKRRATAEQMAEADEQRDALSKRNRQLDQAREQKTAE